MLSCPIAGLACLRASEVTGMGMGYSRDVLVGGYIRMASFAVGTDSSFSSSSSSHLILPHRSSYLPS